MRYKTHQSQPRRQREGQDTLEWNIVTGPMTYATVEVNFDSLKLTLPLAVMRCPIVFEFSISPGLHLLVKEGAFFRSNQKHKQIAISEAVLTTCACGSRTWLMFFLAYRD